MRPPNLHELMLAYAHRGLDDWRLLHDKTRRGVGHRLQNRIADSPTKLGCLSASEARASLFVPAPHHPANRGSACCLFAPIIDRADLGRFSFDLFIYGTGNASLGIRYESGHRSGRHTYPHAQLTQQMLRKTLKPDDLRWIPDRYPAFPTVCSEPVDIFLYMMASIHGFQDGAMEVLKECFQKASQVARARVYGDRLAKVVGMA